MKANENFIKKGSEFYDLVKLVSEKNGYSTRRTRTLPSKIKTIDDESLSDILKEIDIAVDEKDKSDLIKYFQLRSNKLNGIEKMLMNRNDAKTLYEKEFRLKKPKTPPLFNKQKNEKRHESYLACLVQIQAEHILGYNNFNNDPQSLAYFKNSNGKLLKCFSRRFDGLINSVKNPKIVWEIKEYYGTTTFGSRVADGVYETLLDGYEFKALEAKGQKIYHYLFVDDHFTWWELGKSYLCRIFDMMHTGHVDRVYFGKQVVTEFPNDLKEHLDA